MRKEGHEMKKAEERQQGERGDETRREEKKNVRRKETRREEKTIGKRREEKGWRGTVN